MPISREPMLMTRQFTAIIEREDDGFAALCPELDIASQGNTIEEARANLQEALELFLETASPLRAAQAAANHALPAPGRGISGAASCTERQFTQLQTPRAASGRGIRQPPES